MDFVLKHNEMVKKTIRLLEEVGQESTGRGLDPTPMRFAFEIKMDGKIVPIFVINHSKRRLDVYPPAKTVDNSALAKIRKFYINRGYALSPKS